MRFVAAVLLCCSGVLGANKVIPTPQFVQSMGAAMDMALDKPLRVVIGPAASERVTIAADMLRQEFAAAGVRVEIGADRASDGPSVILWDMHRQGRPPFPIEHVAEQILDAARYWGQSYSIEFRENREAWVIGSTDQGVLYGAMTLAQLAERGKEGVSLPAVRIRDYPDFRYRQAGSWLLRAEINRWAYDWGDGRNAYVARIKRKLDFCTRFKINMIFFDGFGWTTEKTPGYNAMMRELNRYARARGIKLMYGGFGSNFEPESIEPEFNIGRIHLNRRSYPFGEIYSCFGQGRGEHPTYGTCRSNQALNEIVAREFEDFVRAVEPDSLYIHHEDISSWEISQARWQLRCADCRRRWSNNDVAAADGGAGAMAWRQKLIFEAIQRVRNTDSGYDALRDCRVVFISPAYAVDYGRSGTGSEPIDPLKNWDKTLELWANIVSQLPRSDNLEVGFREIFPHPRSNERWMDAWRRTLESRNLRTPTYIFFLVGADLYTPGVFNVPYTAGSSMNGLFRGADTIYNFNGGLHQEPQQVLNAEYGWNSTAPGSNIPKEHKQALSQWQRFMDGHDEPAEIFGDGGLFERTCMRIYGPSAGAAMARFFRTSEPPPAGSLPAFYPRRVYPFVVLWRFLSGDSAYWNPAENDRENVVLRRLGLSRDEFHNRLSRYWKHQSEVNGKAKAHVRTAAAAPDLRSDAREDVQYLLHCLEVGDRFASLLSSYHRFLSSNSGRPAVLREQQALNEYLRANFQFQHTDPKGGDQSSWLEALEQIRSHLLRSAPR